MMNQPIPNDVSITAADASSSSEHKERQEMNTPNEASSVNSAPTEEGKAKPMKRGVRGPRNLRRARLPRSTETDIPTTKVVDSPEAIVEGEIDAAGNGNAGNERHSVRTLRNGRKKGDRQQGKLAQKPRNKQSNADTTNSSPRSRSKGSDADEVFSFVTSGAFDNLAAEGDAAQGGMRRYGRQGAAKNVRRDLTADDDAPKLHKVLAEAGLGSRRDMEELIIAGRVSVNGEPAHIGQRILPTDQVRINGKLIQRKIAKRPPRVLIYHKPNGLLSGVLISTRKDCCCLLRPATLPIV
jgi:23S rRNA pseudouridine2605 synthase